MTDAIFEVRLERAARHYADEAVRPIDAVAIADAAMRERRPLDAPERPGLVPLVASPRTSLAASRPSSLRSPGLPSSCRLLRERRPALAVAVAFAQPERHAAADDTRPPGAFLAGQTATWLADQPANLSFGTAVGTGPHGADDLVGRS